MTTYYPSQAGYAQTQPVMYANSGYAPTAGYPQPVYGQPAGVIGVPQVMSTAMPVQAAPVMQMQPGMGGYYQGFNPHQLTWGQRIRLFFGLAPTPSFKYRSDKNSWGFMGYSRRQRFIDPRTGGEVDRHGRPVIRV
ncbi:hypothetical protein CC2G_010615 [Coprinopsis cinerea AmutBmut pab1-1]|nr:hypothetical protein CC2G_010615 [Coprinopsis cinerea AmutBmut pab1-1]